MKSKRIIARLDVKGPNVIKGIQFECLRVMGKPDDLARKYYLAGADELIYLDTVASLYQRNNLLGIVERASRNIFIPLTAGGGVRSLDDIRALLAAGAEKVAINTAATKNPELIRQAAKTFGSQCIVLSIEAKLIGSNRWEVYTDNGRQRTGLDVIKWAKRAERLGAGEILLTSVDMDGTERGFDLDLVKAVGDAVTIPVIASGGTGSPEDTVKCFKGTGADAVAVASILHYRKFSIADIKKNLTKNHIPVRTVLHPGKNQASLKRPSQDNYNQYTLQHLASLTGLAADKIGVQEDSADIQKDYPKGPADIGIIDYKINNVRSVLRAFQKLNKKIALVERPTELGLVKALILPGVGSFGKGMQALDKNGLIEPLKARLAQGMPILGICLGMQMLFSGSTEFGQHQGLGLIAGKVVPFKPPNKMRLADYKLPHIGWNDLMISRKSALLSNIKNRSGVYFVHSFYPKPKDKSAVLARAEYGNQEFCAVVQKNNIMGTQFHPEKSGEAGLTILKNFCRLAGV